MSSSGATAQDAAWRDRERSAEAQYIREKESQQLAELRAKLDAETVKTEGKEKEAIQQETERDFEGGFGGQEDLEDRYATTSGEH